MKFEPSGVKVITIIGKTTFEGWLPEDKQQL